MQEKCYKALIDSGAAISLIRYSTYQLIDNSFKTPIQPTTTNLNTADRSPMTALGMTALHLRIADFKFTHNFIICNRLPDTEIIFGIDKQKKFLLHTKRWQISPDTRNCEQKATIGLLNQLSKYLLDIMTSYLSRSRSEVTQSQGIWHISSVIKISQKERIPI